MENRLHLTERAQLDKKGYLIFDTRKFLDYDTLQNMVLNLRKSLEMEKFYNPKPDEFALFSRYKVEDIKTLHSQPKINEVNMFCKPLHQYIAQLFSKNVLLSAYQINEFETGHEMARHNHQETLCISILDTYRDGDLIVESKDGIETPLHLAAGQAVVMEREIYHTVKPVTDGKKLSLVFSY